MNWKDLKKSRLVSIVVSVVMVLSVLGIVSSGIGCDIPSIQYLTKTYGGIGDTITITGRVVLGQPCFENPDPQGKHGYVTFSYDGDFNHGKKAETYSEWTDTEIKAVVPSGLAAASAPGGGTVFVTTLDGTRSTGQAFTYIVGGVLPLGVGIGNSTTHSTYVAFYSTDGGNTFPITNLIGTVPSWGTLNTTIGVRVGTNPQSLAIRVYGFDLEIGYDINVYLTGSAVFGYCRSIENMTWQWFGYGGYPGTGDQEANFSRVKLNLPDGYYFDVQVNPQ